MVRLGTYEGILMVHDPTMNEKNILFGDEEKRDLPNGDKYSPLDEYKKSLMEESFIPENKSFRMPRLSDHKKVIKVTWIVGGPDDVNVYKEAIDFIKGKFTIG